MPQGSAPSGILYEDDRIRGLRIERDDFGLTYYVLQYRLPRRNASLAKVQLGSTDSASLEEARGTAKRIIRSYIRRGVHPVIETGETFAPGDRPFWLSLLRWLLFFLLAVLSGLAKGARR